MRNRRRPSPERRIDSPLEGVSSSDDVGRLAGVEEDLAELIDLRDLRDEDYGPFDEVLDIAEDGRGPCAVVVSTVKWIASCLGLTKCVNYLPHARTDYHTHF